MYKLMIEDKYMGRHVSVKFGAGSGLGREYVYRVPSNCKVNFEEGDLVVVPPNLVSQRPSLVTVVSVSETYKEKPGISYAEILGTVRTYGDKK